jgi:hypothetical protein
MANPSPTSIEAYLALLPKLGDKQHAAFLEALRFLYANPHLQDVTGTELNGFTGSPNSHKRLSELGRMGLMEVSQIRLSKASIAGDTAVQAWKPTWSTQAVPLKHTPPPTMPTQRQKLIEVLRDIIQDWHCQCGPVVKCLFCRAKDAIENK